MIRIHQQVTIEVSGAVVMETSSETPERAKTATVTDLLPATHGIASVEIPPVKRCKRRKKAKK